MMNISASQAVLASDNVSASRKLINAIKSLKVEPFLFLILFGWSVSSIVTQQLIQDKICLLEYNQTPEFCMTLSDADANNDANRENVKSKILSDLVTFNMKNSFVSIRH